VPVPKAVLTVPDFESDGSDPVNLILVAPWRLKSCVLASGRIHNKGKSLRLIKKLL
jgi:hypothetical protein